MTRKPLAKHFIGLFSLVFLSLLLFIGANYFLSDSFGFVLRLVSSLLVIAFGTAFLLPKSANIIEETTEVLSEKTQIAGGLLQSLGTAFPDMVIGVTAAIMSLSVTQSDYGRAIELAIIAASTTFGSNIYNIGFAIWSVYRQNLADRLHKKVLMIPFLNSAGSLTPIAQQTKKPHLSEIDNSNHILVILSLLTLISAVSMVIFGRITSVPGNIHEDLYQLIRPAGLVIFFATIITLFYFRKVKHPVDQAEPELVTEENYYRRTPTYVIWASLAVAGISILFGAQSMVLAIETFSRLTNLPFVIAGVLAGIIGCIGEIMVVYHFSIHPNGRLGDAITGVAMDNIVTITGASIVAIIGGIFLGGSSLILIFTVILTLNAILIWQLSLLKNSFIKT